MEAIRFLPTMWWRSLGYHKGHGPVISLQLCCDHQDLDSMLPTLVVACANHWWRKSIAIPTAVPPGGGNIGTPKRPGQFTGWSRQREETLEQLAPSEQPHLQHGGVSNSQTVAVLVSYLIVSILPFLSAGERLLSTGQHVFDAEGNQQWFHWNWRLALAS